MSEQNIYKYSGVKLTPGIFSELVIELFDGTLFSRQSAIATIAKHHTQLGGIVEHDRDLVAVFKAATNKMLKQNIGLINKGYGMWELHYRKQDTKIIEDNIEEPKISYIADEIIGDGNKAIYVYYYEAYKERASLKGSAMWECKIGRTDNDPIQRVINQAGTCYPELPRIALIIKSFDSVALEAALHNILKVRGKWIADAPGNEWFMTTPQEIKEMYFLITNSN